MPPSIVIQLSTEFENFSATEKHPLNALSRDLGCDTNSADDSAATLTAVTNGLASRQTLYRPISATSTGMWDDRQLTGRRDVEAFVEHPAS